VLKRLWIERKKTRLIRRMGSSHNEVAVAAAKKLEIRGWLFLPGELLDKV